MSAPAPLPQETIIQGASFCPRYQLQDAAGAALDLTVGTVGLVFRLKPEGAGAVITRTMGGAGESQFTTDGTDGDIVFLFSPTETLALTAGLYTIEVVYTDSASTTKTLSARGPARVEAPKTGAI